MTTAAIALKPLKQGNKPILAQKQRFNVRLAATRHDELLDGPIQPAVESLLQRQYENREQLVELCDDV